MVAVPVPARSGEVLGVVVLHTVAPREFDEGVLNFLVHTASLVAGAIENARLYEESRLRVDALTNLAELSERIVAVGGREELYRVVTGGVRRLLGCDACQLRLRNGEDGRLELVASDPPGELPEPHVESRAALRDDRRGGRRAGRGALGRAYVPGPARGAAPGRRQPGRPGAAQRRAHRAPDRREPRPRALRGARRRGARHRRGPRARRRLRPRPPARLHPRPPRRDRRRGAPVARGRRARRDAAAHARGRRARRPRARRAARAAPAPGRRRPRRRGRTARAGRRARASRSA